MHIKYKQLQLFHIQNFTIKNAKNIQVRNYDIFFNLFLRNYNVLYIYIYI